jgi:hypothetical protein
MSRAGAMVPPCQAVAASGDFVNGHRRRGWFPVESRQKVDVVAAADRSGPGDFIESSSTAMSFSIAADWIDGAVGHSL